MERSALILYIESSDFNNVDGPPLPPSLLCCVPYKIGAFQPGFTLLTLPPPYSKPRGQGSKALRATLGGVLLEGWRVKSNVLCLEPYFSTLSLSPSLPPY